MKIPKQLKNNPIKLIIFDIDGIMTDGRIYYFDDGMEAKAFNVRDGLAIKMILKNKIEVAVISGRKSKATAKRMRDLGIKHFYLGAIDKIKPFNELKKKLKIKNENIAYMGDDLPDIPVMEQVGFSITVADALPEVLKVADYTTKITGGNGAVREACDLILKTGKLKAKW